MARFTVRRLPFGRPPGVEDDDSGEGLPTPARIKLAARRAAGLAEAKAILEHLPEPGESLHAVVSYRADLTDILGALLGKLGRCDRMSIATLGFNRRNQRALLGFLDTAAVGSLSLVASIFFRSHNQNLWQETLAELHNRGQRGACCHSHAKVVTMAFASGARLALEGSANLCGSGSAREQLALIHHAPLHDWHARWITDLLDRHEGRDDE
jgi:hypothetical protein